MSSNAVTRKGDKCTGHAKHKSRPSNQGSPDVFANGKAVHRKGDGWNPHDHPGKLAKGSQTVFVNGKQIGRVRDPVSCGSKVLTGSPDVFAG